MIGVLGGIAAYLVVIGVDIADMAAVAVLGMLGGALLRDVAWFAATARSWPMVAAVLD